MHADGYRVRVWRIDEKAEGAAAAGGNHAHEVIWAGLRSYLSEPQDFGPVTLIALRMRASNNLSAQASRKIAVIATRKVPVWTGSAWTASQVTAAQIGSDLDLLPPAAPGAAIETKVVRGKFGGQPDRRAIPATAPSAGQTAAHAAVVADLSARRPVPAPVDDQREAFRRALELDRAIERGEAVTADQRRWLERFKETPGYRAELSVWQDFGDAIFG